MADTRRPFETVFWDILTDVQEPAADPSAPEGASVEESRVAVVIEDEEDIRSLLSAVLVAGRIRGARRGERLRTASTWCASISLS